MHNKHLPKPHVQTNMLNIPTKSTCRVTLPNQHGESPLESTRGISLPLTLILIYQHMSLWLTLYGCTLTLALFTTPCVPTIQPMSIFSPGAFMTKHLLASASRKATTSIRECYHLTQSHRRPTTI